MPEHPLASVRAYADYRMFGSLPFAGGSFDQPGALMDELRFVASVVLDAENKRAEREARRTQ